MALRRGRLHARPRAASPSPTAARSEAAPDPDAKRRELEDEIAAAQSVFPRAEDFGVHDVIDPRRTRPRIAEWLDEIQEQLAHQVGPKTYALRP